ncbi:glycosyl-4,4'-diaponeurosporenoate acyltransferase CrtO family protein [Algoriphagus machipongonensis]|nr:hypothetical protein [Algoriphagus machipongonensis]
MGKKILLTLGSVFLGYRSYELITSWGNMPLEPLFSKFIMAFLANLFILGVFAFLGFAWPTFKLLPDRYYQINNPKNLLSFTKRIGVPVFQKFLLLTFWRNKAKQKSYFNGSKTGIKNFIIELKRSEIGHLIPFILINLLFIWSLILKDFWTAFFLQSLNIIGNFYPIMLQRAHRARTQRLEKLLKDSTSNSI